MFNNYEEIPAHYRRIILVETGYKRIKRVPLELCIEIIEDHLEYEKECAELMNFELTFERDGATQVSVHKTAKEAFAKLDFEMDYNIFTPGITAVVKQADRIVRAIVGGKVYEGQPRGKIEVKPMPEDRYDTYTLFNGGARCD